LGYLFEKRLARFADPDLLQTAPLYIAGFLIAGAMLLSLAERVGRRLHRLERRTPVDAFVIGLFQALSLLPGFSRSGSSIAGGLFVGLTRADAARFSFLMSAPLIGGAVVWKVRELLHTGIAWGEWLTLLCGVLAAAVSGYACIAFLLAFLRRHSTGLFIYYRYVLGSFIIIAYYVL
jgi:undecaprenyl-diphosphatase